MWKKNGKRMCVPALFLVMVLLSGTVAGCGKDTKALEECIALGDKCLSYNNYEEAVKAYENALAIDPDNTEAKVSLEYAVEMLEEEKRIEENARLEAERLASFGVKASEAKKGAYVTFGNYMQDINSINVKDPIEWIVVKVKDGNALLLSRYILDYRKFFAGEQRLTGWSESDVRVWLNEEFYNDAFNEEEKAYIQLSENKTLWYERLITYRENGKAEETKDYVFLLSSQEYNRYDYEELAEPTAYAATLAPNKSEGHWWLRSIAQDEGNEDFKFVKYVRDGGATGIINSTSTEGIRPAIWVSLIDDM